MKARERETDEGQVRKGLDCDLEIQILISQ